MSNNPGNAAQSSPYTFQAGTLILQLHVQPGASRTGWAGRYGEGALKLRLAAPAVDGKANRACLDFLARAAGVPKRQVTLVRGEKSRDKTVRIDAVSEAGFQSLRAQWEAGA